MYDNAADATKYLTESIVRLGKDPIYIANCFDNGNGVSAEIVNLVTYDMSIISINDPNIDYSPMPLGYVEDSQGRVSFIFRYPRRRWKQGLHAESLGYHPRLPITADLVSKTYAAGLVKTVKGKFKKFKKALDEGGIFHRYFRIVKLDFPYLEYKGDTVGKFVGEELQLEEPYAYLENYVKEVIS